MATGTRRRYTEGFQREAVRLVRDSASPVAQVARDLGIPENVLYRWRTQHRQAIAQGTNCAAQRTEAEELMRLKRVFCTTPIAAANMPRHGTNTCSPPMASLRA